MRNQAATSFAVFIPRIDSLESDMENMITHAICKKCAACCKNYPFVRLSLHEIRELKKLTGLPYEIYSGRIDEAGEEYYLTFKENGDCFFLNENNGDYSCRVYESRSEICRNYPSMPSQNDVCNSNRGMVAK
jgi:Fe-S-cluster containining protein